MIILKIILGFIIFINVVEFYIFNGGVCRDCLGFWKFFDNDSQGGRGYECDGCKRTIWISWFGDFYKKRN